MTQSDIRQIQEGSDVYGSDGEKIGSVSEIGPNHFVVKKGWLFTSDIYIPSSAISGVEQERVQLNVTKEEITRGGWDRPPADEAGAGGYGEGAVYATEDQLTATQTSRTPDTVGVSERTYGSAETESPSATYERETPRESGTIERREEKLEAQTRPEQAGQVRVSKDVVEEQQTVAVPVTREQVEVTSRAVDRPAEGGAFQPEEVTVPVSEERVELRAEPRVVEEVEIGKTARQETEQVTGTVRKERLNVDEEGGVDVDRRG